MHAISYSNARANLASTMLKVCEDHAPVIITRKSEPSVVMMSLDDFEALQETSYLLRAPANTKRLIEAIVELENNQGTQRALME